MDYKEHYRKIGKYLGYPSCCIEEFIRDVENGAYARSPIRKEMAKFGFVPCKEHAELINSHKVKIEDLIVNRECPLPFGRGGEEFSKAFSEYINNIN